VALLCGLGGVTWLASVLIEKKIEAWFENDVALHAHLAVKNAQQSLLSYWNSDQFPQLQSVLDEIARDGEITSAAACAEDFTLLSRTSAFPEVITCSELSYHVRAVPGVTASSMAVWKTECCLPARKLYVSTIPLIFQDVPFGFVAIVHDASYLEAREVQPQRFLVFMFPVLTFTAFAFVVFECPGKT
jgi:hypothetical protein